VRPLGRRQALLVERAHLSRWRRVMPANYLERRALRRLTARGAARFVTGLGCWEVLL